MIKQVELGCIESVSWLCIGATCGTNIPPFVCKFRDWKGCFSLVFFSTLSAA